MRQIGIVTPFIKRDSLLKLADLVQSGGEAKAAVQGGLVEVNGEVCTMRGKKLTPGDRVTFMGETVEIVSA
jgi:ribosome-associated protein